MMARCEGLIRDTDHIAVCGTDYCDLQVVKLG